MTFLRLRRLALAATHLNLTLFIAATRNVEATPVQISSPAEEESHLKATQQTFADDLVPALQTNANDFTSSWGVSMMLSLLHPGSDGATAAQMCDILGYPCVEPPPGSAAGIQDTLPSDGLAWNGTATRLATKYNGDMSLTLEIANSIWIDETSELKPAYQDVVGDFLHRTDFNDAGAGGEVNDWVDESTHGIIDSIVEEGPLPPPLILVALNSIYLNAPWANPFEETNTNQDVFYTKSSLDDGASSMNAHFMHMVDYFSYSHEALPGFQMIQLHYMSNDLSMVIILPDENSDSDPVSSADALKVLPQLSWTRIALALPKFQFESEYKESLKSSLESIGLTAPFQDGAFCGIFTDLCASLSVVKQKTFINVNEKGTEAGAVTMGGLFGAALPTDEPILFMANRPFQFFIYDSVEDLVLFEGHIGAPEIPNGSSATLNAQHADADFWPNNFGVNPVAPPSAVIPQGTVGPSASAPPSSPTGSSTRLLSPEPLDTASSSSLTNWVLAPLGALSASFVTLMCAIGALG